MKMGAERKKVAVLIGLLVVAIVVFMMNSTGAPSAGSAPASVGTTPSVAPGRLPPVTTSREAQPARTRANQRTSNEFRPRLGARRGEEGIDPTTIDPSLRLDILTKLQEVKVEGSRRSIFDFGTAPPPKPDPTELAKKTPVPSPLVKDEPSAEKSETSAEPAKPVAPPIPLKFFGYTSRSNQPVKRAFFMDGDDIHVVSEGDLVKKRYKIVRIGINSVVVEDTQFNQQQTLPLLEEQPG